MATKQPISQRPRKTETAADFCRRMGWGVGTVLLSSEWGTGRFCITAIGEERVLGSWGSIFHESEMIVQWGYKWSAVRPAAKRKGDK